MPIGRAFGWRIVFDSWQQLLGAVAGFSISGGAAFTGHEEKEVID